MQYWTTTNHPQSEWRNMWYSNSKQTAEPIFTVKRRELLAKTLMDWTKILIAAALASEFFVKLPLWLRVILFGFIGILIALGTLVCPKRDA